MHAGFQFVFGGFLPHRFVGATSNSCIFDVSKGLELLRSRQSEPGFFNSPMAGCVAIATRDLGTTCRRAESNQQLMKRAVILAKRPLQHS
jgi:hypothetical protein